MKTNPLSPILLACVLFVPLVENGVAQTSLNTKLIANERLRTVLALPSGLTVTHSPNPASALPNSDPTYRYIWFYTTTVTPKIEGLTVVEFGGFLLNKGKWVFANDTGKAFGPEAFKEWYATPADGVMLMGKNYPDSKNQTVSSDLTAQKALWYFIAQGKDGKKYQGYAMMLCQPRLQKTKAVPSSSATTSSNKVK